MFCSRCGKTLTLEDQRCPHCGNPVGESRFEGTPYTSAQAHIPPNAPAGQAVAAYTRTTYTTMPEAQQQEGELDSRTTYRPVYDDASAPEEIREDLRAAVSAAAEPAAPEEPAPNPEELSDEAITTLNAVDEELKMEDVDLSQFRAQPIESTGRAGISQGVNDFMQQLEDSQNRKAARRRRVYDDGEDTYATPQEGGAREAPAAVNPDIDTEQSEVFNDIDEEEFDELRYGRTIGVREILKVALIMVLAAALIVGGVLWFRHIRGTQSSAKIEGVTESLYSEGIAKVKSHVETDYINSLVSAYSADGILGMTQKLTADAAEIDALLPGEPAVNDNLFISALQAVQSNIGNAILMDAAAAAQGGAENSEENWALVNSSIASLEAASSAQDLTAILNGEQIDVSSATATATPEPTATYKKLAKGDKSDEVLEMQNRLYMLGFLLEDRDGAYGNKTQTAVKLFQSAAGLEVTGIADSQTLAVLYSDDAPRTEYAQVTPTPAPTPTPEPTEAPAAEAGDTASE